MRQVLFVALATLWPLLASAHEVKVHKAYKCPIIDVHLHALPADTNGPPPIFICPGGAASNLEYTGETTWRKKFGERLANPPCDNPIAGSQTDDQVRNQTIEIMRRLNIRGVLSGEPAVVARWRAEAADLFIAGRSLNIARDQVTPAMLAAEYDAGGFEVLAEVSNQYAGILVDDPQFLPFWALAEEKGFPVGIHVGYGPPGTGLLVPSYRLQSPARMEAVLAAHPRLRVYLMHAGHPFSEELKALLYAYPNVHVDVGVLQVALPRTEYHSFLFDLVRTGFGDRIMFGSDQMNWPGLIEEGINAVNSTP